MEGKIFADWLDRHEIGVSEAARLFGCSEQTIYKWRSARGIPDKKDEWVTSTMERYLRSKEERLPDKLVLTPSPEQFDEWNRSALAEGKIVREWILEKLDDAASEIDTGSLGRKRYPENRIPDVRLNDGDANDPEPS